jgi:MIP family channel proteins
MNTTLLRQSISELLGTFVIVFGICGTTMIAFANGGRVMDIALGSGIAVLIVTALFRDLGAHFNPAITVALVFTRRIALVPAGVRIAMQVVGAIAAAVLVAALFPSEAVTGTRAGGTMVNVSVPAVHAWVLEAIGGFTLMLAYSGSLLDSRAGKLAGLPIGLTVALNTFVMAPLSGASMNPARTIGPMVASGIFEGLIIFLTAPVVGAILGALVYEFVFLDRSATPAS